MKFSYNWLQELVPGLDTHPQALLRLITIKTAECEGLEEVGALLANAAPARVLAVQPIPASHHVKAIIQTSAYGNKTVVCGAPNCRPGLHTIYVPIGTKVISGVESDGMLASASELGISKDHSGILELPENHSFALRPDHIIEVDNKSLTHRPDLWGHHGMAREVAAITNRALLDPAKTSLLPAGPASINVAISDFALCPRYSALVFENATVQPSPLWLQYRLQSIGLNPINNIVDVTNLVMSELAQPMHAFDADRLQGRTIFIRPARAGESIVALNDESYNLTPSNLVIADSAGPVAIAGVIGGKESAISNGTTRLVFESACFLASSVRKTSVQLKLRTDASMRFEKSQDPANTIRGLARAIELLHEVSPGIRLTGGLADSHADLPQPQPVDVSIDWLSVKLGRQVTEPEVRHILESLEFKVAQDVPGVLSVRIPSWRATKDVSIKDDLLEEVGRMIGYDAITPQPPKVHATPPPASPERLYFRRLRAMAAAQGFTEVSNYSFLSEESVERFGFSPAAHIRVTNPIASDQTLMRKSLLPGIFKNILENSKHFGSFRLFEIGKEIHPREHGLPDEVPHFMAAIHDREGDGPAALFELKRLAECLLPGATATPAQPRAFEHPQRAADVFWRGERAGRLFELHPSLGIDGRAAVLDLDLRLIETLDNRQLKYQPLRRFPVSAFDLSVVAALREPVGQIAQYLQQAAAQDLVSLDFVREYVGPPLPEGYKSVSYRVTVGADRTLSSDEVAQIRQRIIDSLRTHGYELRI
ncbi:MAG: phenylalanine--tRNA ligase subunit beta [Acidobacteriaceae bacterium]|nr:phenylalanine--tRNA ligase subunit beta [Acidobacteriaceae bacterium]